MQVCGKKSGNLRTVMRTVRDMKEDVLREVSDLSEWTRTRQREESVPVVGGMCPMTSLKENYMMDALRAGTASLRRTRSMV